MIFLCLYYESKALESFILRHSLRSVISFCNPDLVTPGTHNYLSMSNNHPHSKATNQSKHKCYYYIQEGPEMDFLEPSEV